MHANPARNAIVKGGGKVTNLPNGPEVLISKTDKFSKRKFLIFWDSVVAVNGVLIYRVSVFAFSLIIAATGRSSILLSNQERISRYKKALFS